MDSMQILWDGMRDFMRRKVLPLFRPPELQAMRNEVVFGCETFRFYAKAAGLILNAEIRRILGKLTGSRCLFEDRAVELELKPVRRKAIQDENRTSPQGPTF